MGIESKNNFNNKFQKAFYKKFSNWKLAILDENKTVEDAIKNLNKTGLQVCFVHKKKNLLEQLVMEI